MNRKILCDCGAILSVPDSEMNVRARCPKCGASFIPANKKQIKQNTNQEPTKSLPSFLSNKQIENRYVCPNPKCDFSGIVFPESQGVLIPAFLVAMCLITIGVCQIVAIKIAVGDIPSSKAMAIILALSPFLLGFCLIAGITVFITRIVLNLLKIRHCPRCGMRLG